MLLLFDVDGTLFLTHDVLYAPANLSSVEDVYGLRLPGDAMDGIGEPGQTALKTTRQLLRAAGLEDGRIDAGLGDWCEAFSARYLELLADADTSAWRPAPSAAEILTGLERHAALALLTGNPEPMARARLERLGLARFFPRGLGAFGCDAEERPALIRLALRRAGAEAADAVAIGDAPNDVRGAREAGIRVIAVESPAVERAQLAGADAVISSLRELPAAVAALPA
jgi:phosphoglycolate phosphatase